MGTPSATFVWKVLYRDADANPPAQVRVHILSSGAEITGSPFTMTLEGSPNYTSGATFTYQRSLPVGRAYTYFFDAADAQSPATGTPTSAQSGPVVTNAPSLAWTGQPGYESGGFTPPSGFADDTLFDWRVTYTDPDGDAPTGVFLHVLFNGVDVVNSPFAMTRVSGAYSTGAIFQVTNTLLQASDTGLTYYFVASDGVYSATGPPTSPHQGPPVQYRPELVFPTDVGFELTGVSPQAGLSTGVFHFEVVYSHQGGVLPLLRGGPHHPRRGRGRRQPLRPDGPRLRLHPYRPQVRRRHLSARVQGLCPLVRRHRLVDSGLRPRDQARRRSHL